MKFTLLSGDITELTPDEVLEKLKKDPKNVRLWVWDRTLSTEPVKWRRIKSVVMGETSAPFLTEEGGGEAFQHAGIFERHLGIHIEQLLEEYRKLEQLWKQEKSPF